LYRAAASFGHVYALHGNLDNLQKARGTRQNRLDTSRFDFGSKIRFGQGAKMDYIALRHAHTPEGAPGFLSRWMGVPVQCQSARVSVPGERLNEILAKYAAAHAEAFRPPR
jgi:hypothetical protein